MTESQLKSMYEEFVDQFDPTPQYGGEDYNSLPDYDTWRHDYLAGEHYATACFNELEPGDEANDWGRSYADEDDGDS